VSIVLLSLLLPDILYYLNVRQNRTPMITIEPRVCHRRADVEKSPHISIRIDARVVS